MAQRFANLARELAAANDRLSEKEEQIDELKSERSNTRVSFGYYKENRLKSSLTQPTISLESPLNFTIHRTSCLYLYTHRDDYSHCILSPKRNLYRENSVCVIAILCLL